MWRLADAFPDALLTELQKAGFADDKSVRVKSGSVKKKLATPRRLVALLENIKDKSEAQEMFRRGPQLSACKDADGSPTKALVGFMQSVGATCEKDLETVEEKGKTYIAWSGKTPVCKLADDLAAIVQQVLLNLPAPRLMRWGENDFKFIRPVRGVLLLHGDKPIKGTVLGVPVENKTVGHPVLGGEISAITADDYESVMRESGKVIVDMDQRLKTIHKTLANAEIGKGRAFMEDFPEEVQNNQSVTTDRNVVSVESPLLREVAAMCEFPIMYRRKIDEEFMSLPMHCISQCMIKHQRFFPFEDGKENLLPDYVLVADSESKNPEIMLHGYDAVLRARLRDVKFYYEEDKKIPLNEYVEKLKSITFHKKLGSQYDRINRVCRIASAIQESRGENYSSEEIESVTKKYLAPLPSLMVSEYPDLQEYMSRRYFGKDDSFDFISICYDLEKLAGMFGAGEIPTGSKDPHGLRRNALNIAHYFWEWNDIKFVITAAIDSFDGTIANQRDDIYEFIFDRIEFIFSKQSPFRLVDEVPPNVMKAIRAHSPSDLRNLKDIVCALRDFTHLEESQTLAAANKRINNIFRKSEVDADALPPPDESLFAEEAERVLHNTVRDLQTKTESQIAKNNYKAALQTLAEAAGPVNTFFDDVLVNDKDEKIRRNRFALLAQLRTLLNSVADISKLAA